MKKYLLTLGLTLVFMCTCASRGDTPQSDTELVDKICLLRAKISTVVFPIRADDFLKMVSSFVSIRTSAGHSSKEKILEEECLLGTESAVGYMAVQLELDRAGEGRKVVSSRIIYVFYGGLHFREITPLEEMKK